MAGCRDRADAGGAQVFPVRGSRRRSGGRDRPSAQLPQASSSTDGRAMEPWPDAAALSRLSLPYGFVTNTSTALAGIASDRSRLRPRFTLSAEEAGWFKPEPPIYRAACERLGLDPARVAFVAGSPYDAAGARGAGMLCVARRSASRPRFAGAEHSDRELDARGRGRTRARRFGAGIWW